MSSVFEIIELADGSIELRRQGDSQSESLVKIDFSQESLVALGDQTAKVAKAMIQAGLEQVAALSGMQFETHIEEISSDELGLMEDDFSEGELEQDMDLIAEIKTQVLQAVGEDAEEYDLTHMQPDSGTLH